MDTVVHLEYQFGVHTIASNGWKLPFIKIAEPFAYIGDLHQIGNSDLPLLIRDLEAVLEGRSAELVEFGGERVICTTQGAKTYCEDMHTQDHCIVETTWMVQMLKNFWEFRNLHPAG